MPGQSVSINRVGLVTSVGLSAPAACAAIRAALTNHTETHFVDAAGDRVIAAQVPLDQPWRGRAKLVRMLELAIMDCLAPVQVESGTLPLLLCVAEESRPGRLKGLDEEILPAVSAQLGMEFHPTLSSVIPHGRVGVAAALQHARMLLHDRALHAVLIGATDSLVTAETIATLELEGRLLTPSNSNGLVPGEAAGAVLVTRTAAPPASLTCHGLGFATERATVWNDAPLRADGLTEAIRKALAEAGCSLHDLDYRLTDNSGEQYYFKEAALALSRMLRQRKESFDIWHPADSVGETGAAIGAIALAVALTAGIKGYALGPGALFHAGTDDGRRASVVLRLEGASNGQ